MDKILEKHALDLIRNLDLDEHETTPLPSTEKVYNPFENFRNVQTSSPIHSPIRSPLGDSRFTSQYSFFSSSEENNELNLLSNSGRSGRRKTLSVGKDFYSQEKTSNNSYKKKYYKPSSNSGDNFSLTPVGKKTFQFKNTYLHWCEKLKISPAPELLRTLKLALRTQQPFVRLSICHAGVDNSHVQALVHALKTHDGVNEILLNHNSITDDVCIFNFCPSLFLGCFLIGRNFKK